MPFTTVAGAKVHWLEAGTGEPALVLLHAFPLHAAMCEEELVSLGRGRRVVAPDLPGFGRSAPLGEPEAATMGAWADHVAAFLEHLGIGPVVVGGLSMGGYLTFAMWRRHSELVAGVVLCDTRAAADTPEVSERRTAQQQQVAAEGTGGLIESTLSTLLSDDTLAHRPDVVERARAIMAANPPPAFIAGLEAMKRRPDATAELAGIDVPALVVVGEHDGPSPPSVAREMADALPDARLTIVPAAGHLSNLENPEAFDGAVDSFLAGL
jgi:pimeloyl-ACP methyl ester carboxylesterase